MKIENIIMKYLNKKIMALILCLLFFAIPMIVNAAEPTGDKLDGDVLNNITVRFRPVGSISALAVKDNGAWGQNVVHMYHLGESSRFYLIKADSDSYYIRFFSDNTKDSSDLAHIEDRYSEKILDLESNDNYQREGSVVHVVTGNETANNKRWKFYKQEDGTYLIVNKVSNQYWSLKDNDINANENKLCQSKTPFYWEIEIVDCPNNRSIDSNLKRYDSYTFMHDDERVSSINWMSKLPDYIPITDLNIPGVHDAATVSMDLNIASSCQMLYIDDLLDAGVRYFDLRLGTSLLAEGDSLTLQHGIDNCLNRHYDLFYMDELFLWYIDFLDKNPGETVIFQVLNVGDSEKEIYNYFKRFAEGSDYLYIGDHVPTLGEVRGKIVLISRIDLSKVSEDANYDIEIDGKTMQWALDCRNWQIGKNNNTAFVTSGKDFEVWSQDNYDMSADDKWPWVDGSISNAKNRKEIAEENGKKAWVVSYTSVSHLPGTTPLSGARNMNRRVKNAMNSNRWESDSGFLGVICSDFMDEQLSQMIYKTNFDREFEKPITYYNISFVNDDGSVLQSCEVAEGVLPEYSGDVPNKSGDEEYTYEFLEWTPEIEEACEDATYTATYTAIKKEESGDIENPSGDVSTESGDTEKPSGDVSTESGDTEKPSGDTPSESGETINKEDKPTNNKGGSSSGGSSSSSYKITTISNEKNIEISPKNPTVKRNNDQEFIFIVADGYELEDVLVDGKSIGIVDKYIFNKVKEKHTIEVKGKKSASWSNADDWAIKELEEADSNNLIPSILLGEDFSKPITRLEYAHIALQLYEKLVGTNVDSVANNHFIDTNDSEVLKAYKVGITLGTSDKTFTPDALITREQMATMTERALTKAGIDTRVDLENVSKFTDDNLMHAWGKDAIYFMSNIEIIKGVGDNTFNVLGNATRQEALLILTRCAKKFSK